MAKYQVTSPDGQNYEVEAPEDASEQDVISYAQQQFSKQEQPAAVSQGRPENEITSMPLTALLNRPNTPQPTILQQAGKYVANYGRGILNATAGVGIAAGTNPLATAGGVLEAGAALGSGMVAPFSAAMGNLSQGRGGREVSPEEFTYQPRTQTGRSLLNLLGAVTQPVTDSGADIALGPLAMEASALPRMPRPGPQVAPSSTVGAAAAATDLSAVSPELRSAVTTAGRRGNVSNEAVARHVEAESLPVPIRLTEGEATQNPILLSHERNLRGKHEEMVKRMDESNKALGANLSDLRERIGSEVFSTNAVEHGDTLIAAYKAKDAAAEANIAAKYKALRDANGGQFPIDAPLLLDNVVQNLHQQLLLDHAPKAAMATLERLANKGSMTFENFESLRTNLARTQRSMTADGNERFAAGVIRQAMEELPMRTVEAGENLLATEGAGSGAAQRLVNQQYRFTKMKKLADEARAASRQRFQALEADPAYEAAVNDAVPPDRFVQKFIVGAPRDQLAATMKNLGSDPKVRQTISVSVLDHLRDSARLSPSYEGNFSAAGYNKALQSLAPKANLLFDADTAETLGKLGNVSRYTTAQPRGSFINNSNTLVGRLSKPVLGTLEGVANYASMGIPTGTMARALLEKASAGRRINRSLKPGAGIAQPRRGISGAAADETKRE